DTLGQSVRRSFYPERSGDLMVLLEPYYLMLPTLTGTTHGTPYPYDTHVPLLVYGPGIHHATRQDPVTPQAAAVILARTVGIRPAARAAVPVPSDLFGPETP